MRGRGTPREDKLSPFIIAELSANHLGSLQRALALIEAAQAAGADAVKFQTFTPEQMVEPDVVIQEGPWVGRNALDLYRQTCTPRHWQRIMFQYAADIGIVAFSSVFHPDDVDFLETLGCPMYKISSFEITDLALIKHAAATGKPLFISTGMASFEDIALAAEAAGKGVTLLKCTSAYPAKVEDANLATMVELKTFGRSGLSDHTLGLTVAGAATALGADAIEKHLTLTRADGGPDAGFSMEPHEFAEMVAHCRQVAASIGEVRYGPTDAERAHLSLRRKSGGKRGA